MRARFRSSMNILLIITVFALTACSSGNNETSNATTIRNENTDSSTGTSQDSNDDGRESTSTPVETPFLIGTPQGGSKVDKNVPAGSAPTQVHIAETESPFDADGDGRYTFEELVQAVEALYPTYEWPPNYRTTPELILSGFAPMAEQDARWRVPYEYTLMGGVHQCAWELTWLDAYRDGNTALMDESLYQLRTIALTRPTLHPNSVEFLSEAFDQAALGDPTVIQQIVDTSCQMEWSTPEAGTPSASSFSEPESSFATTGRFY